MQEELQQKELEETSWAIEYRRSSVWNDQEVGTEIRQIVLEKKREMKFINKSSWKGQTEEKIRYEQER